MRKFFDEQLKVCSRIGISCERIGEDSIIGLGRNIGTASMPINGLRHPPTGRSSGWYIWAGKYSDAEDYFEPVHVRHLLEKYPFVLAYLGLPPGWRFQIDDKGYEDVWEDEELLDV